MGFEIETKVLLPARIFEQATSKEHLIEMVKEYVKHPRYTNYRIKRIEKPFAICTRGGY